MIRIGQSTFFLALLVLLTPFEAQSETKLGEKAKYSCPAAKEFITTYNYLKASREFKLNDQNIEEVASKVAKGCQGAAERFIQTTATLLKAKAPSSNAIRIATKLALATNDVKESFLLVFKTAYLTKYLDMGLVPAIQLAESLSTEFNGKPVVARDDFARLVRYCIDRAGLALTKPKCASLAARITRYGELLKEEQVAIAPAFIKIFEFITQNKKGPMLISSDGLNVAEEMVKVSPYAVDNFIESYQFAIAGMKLNRADAIKVAKKIARETVQKTAL